MIRFLLPCLFCLTFAGSVASLSGCDSGSKPGDTNVEEGSAKDKDPTAHNETGANTNSEIDTHQDTIDALMDTAKLKNDPYERSKRASHTDAPNQGR